MKRRMMLYFGSFNPIHKGHIQLAEYVVESGLCDDLVMVVSPQNPLKSSADLAPELERFTMAELAATESRYPDRIKPSVVEFMLERPSYTINTLRHLTSEYGAQFEFSILMGGDLVEQLHKWREYEEILENYPIYVYPREGCEVDKHLDKITLLEGAPLFNISSSEIREAIKSGQKVDESLPPSVIKHIHDIGLWGARPLNNRIVTLMAKGKESYREERWGDALNSFNEVLALDSTHQEAQQMAMMTKQILEFRYKDIYNP